MTIRGALRRLLGRDDLPAGFAGPLGADENVLGSAVLTGGGHVVVTSLGLWLGDRRLGWHLVSRASWQNGAITLVEAREVDVAGGAVLIEDLPVRRLRLASPGRVPEVVHTRVTASIRSRHHRELPGGGAWFVQRKVPGRDGIVLQVRADPGTDAAAVRQVAADVARALRPA
ncbi:MAG: hypothetical protein LH603_01180 [Pseudonocardia sp.]|nr:hypothetical protein [Pseudonocardia sp.]